MRRFKGWLRIGAGARFGSGCLDRWDGANIDLTLGVPRVVRGLHPDPDAGAVAEQLAEAHGDGGGHGLSLIEDVVEVLARDAEQTCDLRLRPCDRRDNLFAQQLARMTRAAVRVATCGNLGHDLLSPGHSSLDEAHAPRPLASRRLRLDFDVSAERPGIAEQALEREPAELSSQQLG